MVRLYIVVEGLYANVGTVCPLPAVIKLKEQFGGGGSPLAFGRLS